MTRNDYGDIALHSAYLYGASYNAIKMLMERSRYDKEQL